jgi:hypothetical protein
MSEPPAGEHVNRRRDAMTVPMLENRLDPFGDPICPVCQVSITPGKNTGFEERQVLHLGCWLKQRQRAASGAESE